MIATEERASEREASDELELDSTRSGSPTETADLRTGGPREYHRLALALLWRVPEGRPVSLVRGASSGSLSKTISALSGERLRWQQANSLVNPRGAMAKTP